MLTLQATRTYAVQTPKLGQNRKAAATRDALDRRGLRVTNFQDRLRQIASLSETFEGLFKRSAVLTAFLTLLTLPQEFGNASAGILLFRGAER